MDKKKVGENDSRSLLLNYKLDNSCKTIIY